MNFEQTEATKETFLTSAWVKQCQGSKTTHTLYSTVLSCPEKHYATRGHL